MTRRAVLKTVAGLGAGLVLGPERLLAATRSLGVPLGGLEPFPNLLTKPIPSSGEELPVVGIGTARGFWREGTELESPRAVLRDLVRIGGKVVDTAPSYGEAETAIGTLVKELGIRDKVFLATKIDAGEGGRDAGLAQFEQAKRRLQSSRIDLLQVHNLRGVKQMLPLFRELKQQQQIRYLGVTTTFDRQYDELATLLQQEAVDFVQVDYAVDSREVEQRILPLAKDRGVAVLTAMPFGNRRFLQKFGERPLPDWTAELGIKSWAQFALKYIVSHPAVVAAIPGTSRPEHLADNLAAAQGKFLDEAARKKMAAYVDAE